MALFKILLVITICSILLCIIVYLKPELYASLTGTAPPQIQIDAISDFPLGPSAFPEYINMKGPDVLVALNRDHPEYSIEIVNIDTMPTYDATNFREDRVRIFVSRGRLVKQIKIG
jgi:hypothetical protein